MLLILRMPLLCRRSRPLQEQSVFRAEQESRSAIGGFVRFLPKASPHGDPPLFPGDLLHGRSLGTTMPLRKPACNRHYCTRTLAVATAPSRSSISKALHRASQRPNVVARRPGRPGRRRQPIHKDRYSASVDSTAAARALSSSRGLRRSPRKPARRTKLPAVPPANCDADANKAVTA